MRFIPSSDSSRILIGQPVQQDIDVGKALRAGKQVDVSIFSGTSVLQPGTDTGNVETIQRILSPLAQNEVGTIRCIGLNVSSGLSHYVPTSSLADLVDTVQAACRGSPHATAISTHGLHVGRIRMQQLRKGSIFLTLDRLTGSRTRLSGIPGQQQQ